MKKLIMVVLVAAGLTSCNEQKTAYVDTTKLIQEYKEMKDVEQESLQNLIKLRSNWIHLLKVSKLK